MSTTRKNDRLVWVDMEMSGLLPETDRILEIAMIVTDGDLNIVAEGPVLIAWMPGIRALTVNLV
jgi:oligoribonuclease